jgi:hypothetical protein
MAIEPPIPIEIPWQLASTTQPLVVGQPAETAISLFTFEPDAEATTKDFPDQRLIFFKVTTTISPAAFPTGTAPVAASMLGEGVPCYHAQLDLVVRKKGGDPGAIRPYFHAAAPLRREMLATGVIGGENFEGTADHQAMGKSSSQVHETSATHTSTASISAGGSFLGIGASASLTSTDIAGRRSVDQVSDTTTRDAAQERRELVSHMTRVENVLTLLNAKYVGTPYLRFSMSPRPLEQLSVDSSDPSLWFGQLLQRRSSGVEGIQEFTMVVIVPKGEDFCVTAKLKRVCVLDDPPVEPDFGEPFSFNGPVLGRLLNYVYRIYPVGTPVDDLDVDIHDTSNGALGPGRRPVIENWVVAVSGAMRVEAIAMVNAGPNVSSVVRGSGNYKTFVELWLETLRDEYERDCARSPLERGVLLGETRTLETCFTFAPNGGLGVLSSAVSVTPLRPVRIGPRELGLAGLPSSTLTSARSTKARALETVVRWNALNARLAKLLDNPIADDGKGPGKLNDIRIVNVLIDRWAKLEADDPRNVGLPELAEAFGFDRQRLALFKSAGIADLKGMAHALKSAPAIERHNNVVAQGAAVRKTARAAGDGRTAIAFPIDRKLAKAIVAEIGDKLFSAVDGQAQR